MKEELRSSGQSLAGRIAGSPRLGCRQGNASLRRTHIEKGAEEMIEILIYSILIVANPFVYKGFFT